MSEKKIMEEKVSRFLKDQADVLCSACQRYLNGTKFIHKQSGTKLTNTCEDCRKVKRDEYHRSKEKKKSKAAFRKKFKANRRNIFQLWAAEQTAITTYEAPSDDNRSKKKRRVSKE